jgi:hypothetical protein
MPPSNPGNSLFGLYVIHWVTVLKWGLAVLRNLQEKGKSTAGDSAFGYTEYVYLLMTQELKSTVAGCN